MKCLSCGSALSESFCPCCGEKAEVKRISFTSIVGSVLSSFTNMDSGFLLNIKSLILRPKVFVEGYLLGKRRGILNPISFLIFSASMYLIVESLLLEPKQYRDARAPTGVYVREVAYTAGMYIRAYFKYFWILSIIPLAASTKLIFKKYNYAEHLVIASFILGLATIVGLINFLVLRTNMVINPLVYLTILLLVFAIFKEQKFKFEMLLSSLAVILVFVLELAIIVLGVGLLMT